MLKEINRQNKRCYYGFIRCSKSDYYFVELKGSDIEKAVQQLINTIQYFRLHYRLTHQKTYAYIASTGVPAAANQKFRKLQDRFQKEKWGVELKRKTNIYKHFVSTI